MKLVIDEIGGNCPVQAEGTVDGFRFYFRARGKHWSFEVYDGNEDPWDTGGKYSDEPYAAGWMSEEEARSLIEQAARVFHNRPPYREPDDDGQPDERQEWHDYDPDC